MDQKFRIFLIEDDSLVVHLYERTFTLNGFDVEVAYDGVEGLDKLSKSEELPAVIILDLMLPKMTGFDVLRELKKNPKTKSIPVIVLSNLAQTNDIDETLKLGAAMHLVKSQHDPEDLVKKIKEVISVKESAS